MEPLGMNKRSSPSSSPVPLSQAQRVNAVCDRFERAWQAGPRPLIEDFLGVTSEPERSALLRELVALDIAYRRKAGEQPQPDEYRARFPGLTLSDELFSESAVQAHLPKLSAGTPPPPEAGEPLTGLLADEERAVMADRGPLTVPGYEILGELGRGGMGVVYKARHLALQRLVALKMILAGRHAGTDQLRRLRTEAEAVARLQHPHIVQIYEIADHNGLPYLALEYVEGGSLAGKLDGTPLPPLEAASLVEMLARAVDYAHRRGIVHRDLKPGNILLQPSVSPDPPSEPTAAAGAARGFRAAEFTPKVTDFGLAKKLDESAGQTASGAILGTPRYMAPEQAGGNTRAIGPAADIYALGAILYELATGRFVFDADTPQGVIARVLNAEPVPPRQLCPAIPRNLETIILKCLAKEPARRYATARALADDLRAFAEGRPITARRPNLAERLGRWARQQRTSGRVAVMAAGAAVVLVLAALAVWRSYRDAQIGWLTFTTEGPNLVAEVLGADSDDLVVPRFTIPNPDPLALPAGWYRLRVMAAGQLSETYQVLVERDTRRSFPVGVNDRQLWAPVEVGKFCGGLELLEWVGPDGIPRADPIVQEWDRLERDRKELLLRVDGRTGKVMWKRGLEKNELPALADVNPDQLKSIGLGRLLQPAPDLDGDGIPDLVWTGWAGTREDPCPFILAMSGRDGTVLWYFRSPAASRLACPLLLTDVDGDGQPDLIAVFSRLQHARTGEAMEWKIDSDGRLPNVFFVQTWVEAIGGRTGRSLWRYDLPSQTDCRARQLQQRVAILMTSPLMGFPQGLPFLRVSSPDPFRHGEYDWRDWPEDVPQLQQAAVLHRAAPRTIAVVGTYKVVVGLDVRTGQPAWPERRLAMPLLNLSPDGEQAVIAHARAQGDPVVAAISPATGEPIWVQTTTDEGVTTRNDGSFAPLPRFADLDGDGKPEVLFPFQVLDGATGEPRWLQRQVLRFPRWDPYLRQAEIVGPDVNGDGHRDLFRACFLPTERFGLPEANRSRLLRTEIRSGADGKCLLRGQCWLGKDPETYQRITDGYEPLRWLPAGPAGLPRLLLSTAHYFPCQTTTLFSYDGRLEHIWRHVEHVNSADLDGDGIPDLYGLHVDKAGVTWLHAVRGFSPELWRRPGIWGPVRVKGVSPDNLCPPLPHGDLDGDGVPDVLTFSPGWDGIPKGPLSAYSGKTGRRLWQVDGTDLGGERDDRFGWVECRDLDGDGRPEVVIGTSAGVAVLDGRSGKLRWSASQGEIIALADVNGDGVLDVVVQSPIDRSGQRFEYFAYDGRTGQKLTPENLKPEDYADSVRSGDGKSGYFLFGDLGWHLHRRHSRSYDLTGDGTCHRLVAEGGKLRARSDPGGKLLWECPVPSVAVTGVRPATSGHPAEVIVVGPGGSPLYGLDGATGRSRWRCHLPDRYDARYLLYGDRPGDLPAVAFHFPRPLRITICLRASPTNPDGSFQHPTLQPADDGAPSEPAPWVVPYPWEFTARQQLAWALWPGLACLVALLGFLRWRRWGTVAFLAGCFLAAPWLRDSGQLDLSEFPDESHTLGGWLLRWPYALTTWKGWGVLGNPAVWMAAWVLGLGVRHCWRRLRGPGVRAPVGGTVFLDENSL
jgi:outer membrane protein assembly factor BamB